MNKIIIDYRTREKRYAVIENEKVLKLNIAQPEQDSMVGRIYLGKVEKVENGIGAAFVDIGEGKNGYLSRDQIPAYIHNESNNKEMMALTKFIRQGEKLLVQVKKDESDTKGPLLTGVLEFSGKKAVYMPHGKYIAVSKKAPEETRDRLRGFGNEQKKDGEGFIFRTEAFESTEEELMQELNKLRTRYQHIQQEAEKSPAPSLIHAPALFLGEITNEMDRLGTGAVICDDASFLKDIKDSQPDGEWEYTLYTDKKNIMVSYDIEKEYERALKQIIWLDSGAYLIVEETEALTVFDVNTGKFTGKSQLGDTIIKTNLEAADEIARQIILRDYSGIILIDFIDMKSENDRKKVIKSLENILRRDPKYFRIVGFTSLGILQVTRKKTKKSIPEYILADCPVCKGTGKIKSPETVAFELERLLWERPFGEHESVLIEATEEVMDVFKGENAKHLKRIETILNVRIFFSRLEGHPNHHFNLKQFGTIREIKKMV
ncbi:Rne/Rng family ribonuclease [Falsibacillus pallidus]|uniref:Ribonuclease G n=1 Tax=Falsibacillus pallidus TaxID=493781 RepID=A0A370GK35_9BACI|nr:Rne/Rng family ribonuclease [Falsibacillus pallidus]RDI44142.1 ribonuclease G [Falsibacillus pallidus]